MSLFRELSYAGAEIDDVKGVQFCLLDPEDIKKRSVVHVQTTDTYVGNEPVLNGLYDPRMGVTDSSRLCGTCEQRSTFCPGHFGHIELCTPVFYHQYMNFVRKILQCVCIRCSKLKHGRESVELQGILKRSQRMARWNHVHKLCSKVMVCGQHNGEGCGARNPDKITKNSIKGFVLEWKPGALEDDSLRKQNFGAPEVLEILKRITDEDVDALGLSSKYSRPEWMICTVLPVPPPAVRPCVHHETGQRQEDDLSYTLGHIIKNNNVLAAKIAKDDKKEYIEGYALQLQYHVVTLVETKIQGITPPTHKRSGRTLASLADRLTGKEGRIRGNLMGKRVDFSARSVITPDPNISIDDVGVPMRIAMNLTFPETVSDLNRAALQKMVLNGPDVYPGAKMVRKNKEGSRLIRLKNVPDRSGIVLDDGDVVERHLLDGDYVLFNRQPSLHRMSMMGHRVRVMPFNTFRISTSVCTSFNADFDGDEMNMHVPQSHTTAVELERLASVTTQIVSPKNAAPIIAIVQDTVLGVWRMTQDHVRLDKATMFNMMSVLRRLPAVPEPHEHDADGNPLWTGRQLLSCVIPKNITVTMKNKQGNPVKIVNGVIQEGVVDAGIYQAQTKGLAHSVFVECGPEATRDLFDDTQKLVCAWLMHTGFSVGVADLFTTKEVDDFVAQTSKEMKRKVYDMIGDVHTGRFNNPDIISDGDYLETQINNALNSVTDPVSKTVAQSLGQGGDNRMLNMILSGAKGKPANMLQMVAFLGQQNVERVRISEGFEHRTLPHFTKFDDGPDAKGWVQNSFFSGLNPVEFFFHAMGGRDGLIDTAVKTSQVGYMQRRVVKAMEDCKVHYDLTVRNAGGQIVQFLYGEDGMDATRIEKQRILYAEMNPLQLAVSYSIGDPASEFAGILEPSVMDKMMATKDWRDKTHAHFMQLVQDRELLFAKMFPRGAGVPDNLMYPVAFDRILSMAHAMNYEPDALSDLDPLYAIRKLDELVEDVPGVGNMCSKLFGVLCRMYLSPKRLIQKYRMRKSQFDDVLKVVRQRHEFSLAHSGEMVGVVAAQSIGEPLTQLTLNSVHYDTMMLLRVDGRLVKTKMGDFVHDIVDRAAKADIEDHPNDTLLAWIKNNEVAVMSCDEDGKVDWQKVEAVTRHPVVNEDGSSTLLKVTLDSGREVIATKGKSFLTRQNNKIVQTNGSDLKVGDFLPVSKGLDVDCCKITHLDLSLYLPKTEYTYMSEIRKALEFRETEKFWWKKGKGVVFEVPYKRGDALLENFVTCIKAGNPRNQEYRENCVYPRCAIRVQTHIPEQIPLDELFGFFCGAYLAEGCLTSHHTLISNVDDAYNARIIEFCDRYNVKYHVDHRFINNGVSHTIRIHSLVLTTLIFKLLGKMSDGKRIDASLLGAPKEFLKGLVDGYFSGDGSVQGRKITAYSTSRELLRDMQQVLIIFGIRSRTTSAVISQKQIDKFHSVKPAWILHILGQYALCFAETFVLTLPKKRKLLEEMWSKPFYYAKHWRKEYVPNVQLSGGVATMTVDEVTELILDDGLGEDDLAILKSIQDEDVFWDKVVGIDDIEYEFPYVYDLTVENTKNFAQFDGTHVRDTFHSSGMASASSVIGGVARIQELMGATRNIKTPSMRIVPSPEICHDKMLCNRLLNRVQVLRFEQLVSRSRVFYDPTDAATKIADDEGLLREYAKFAELDPHSCSTEADPRNPWVLRIELNRDAMVERGVTMAEISDAMIEAHEHRVRCVYSDESDPQLIFRLRLDKPESDDALTELRAFEANLMENLIIWGIRGLDRVTMEERQVTKYDAHSKVYQKHKEWQLHSSGTSLIALLGRNGVDARHTVTNDVVEVCEVLGIEASRQALINEFSLAMSESEISFRHVSMLVDTMTNRGRISSVDRHGMSRSRNDVGVFSKASFEKSVDNIITSAVFAEKDPMTSVAANVILGQVAPCGTGQTDLIFDVEQYLKTAEELGISVSGNDVVVFENPSDGKRGWDESDEVFDVLSKTAASTGAVLAPALLRLNLPTPSKAVNHIQMPAVIVQG